MSRIVVVGINVEEEKLGRLANRLDAWFGLAFKPPIVAFWDALVEKFARR